MELFVKILENGFDIAGGTFDVFVQLAAFLHSSHSAIGQGK
jgi:hypothetical protein